MLIVIFIFIFWIWLPLLTGRLAVRKGYSFLWWTLGGGLVGLVFLSFLPFANQPNGNPKVQADLKRKGNALGAALAAVFCLLLALKLFKLL